ncbi:MAG: membrane dipeptidase [Deltaproteobacteria bacterium]|nr:membrane dipeptidase [Deltaproteobacteria bacterium]MBW2393559.1 membrane dipeptidase [Deltaproteobacteria bacterium]
MSDWGISTEAAELHADALVWDMTQPIITPGSGERKEVLFDRIAGAGFDFVSITLAIDGMDLRAAAQQLVNYRWFVAERSERCVIVESVADVAHAREQGLLAVGFHFQGTAPFEDNSDWVELFYRLGVRHALMAYNEPNLVGVGCHAEEDTGLTEFGRGLIGEMNRVGMVVDCAHTGYRTTMETFEASQVPAIISHTNVRELCDHPRCVWDDQIVACAEQGGVIGMTCLSGFLGGEGSTPARIVDHIDHVVQLVGPSHVGLGLDYVYDLPSFEAFVAKLPDRYPPGSGYTDMRQLELEEAPRITEELLRRGYGEKDIRGILGENWLRVCGEIWK